MGLGNMSRQQWLTVITFVVVNFCNAMCVSMQAPFYPREAVSKGLEVWHFGLVFGAFEITVFIVSPIIGNHINRLGVKKTLNIGIGAVGVILILYGCLGMLKSGKLFLAFSFILRIFEACGNSAFLTGSFSAIAREFPTRVASMFSLIELFFGIGEIVGPVVGGALYEVGGFVLPFAVMGSLLFASSIFIFFVLPDPPYIQIEGEKPSMKQALSKPAIGIALFKVMTAAASLGFLQTTLEPHLHDLKVNGHALSSFQVGALFMAVGGTYGISLPLWGFLCDSTLSRNSPKMVEIFGALFIGSGFVVLGPMKGMPFDKSLGSIIAGMALHGFGLGASVVGGFADAHKSAIKAGFPDTIDTYGLVSGLWTSVFAFGAFIGPVLGGILYDALTFRWALLFIVALEIIAFFLLVGYLICTWNEPVVPVTRSISTISETDEVADIQPPSYGTGVTVQGQTRSRKFSESIRGSYMASSLARSMARPGMVGGLGAASVARRQMLSS
jgi:MFS family permease